MSSNLRIRIKFDSTPLNHSQKCWFTFDGEKCKMVSDVRHLIASRFNMKPQGIQVCLHAHTTMELQNSDLVL